jgi:acyl-CoA hydrolase
MTEYLMTYRKLVMPGDENHARSLFGGSLLKWSDEATAVFAMCQMGTQSVVTLKISEIIFRHPARSGDILEFWARTKRVGTTSLTVECAVIRKSIDVPGVRSPKPDVIHPEDKNLILNCEFVFVAVDQNGKPTPHALSKKQ